jgi:hypothetical protein
MNLKKIKKNIQNTKNSRFTYELTPWGSLVSSLLIVSGKKWSNAKYCRLFDRATFPYLDDEDFVGNTLKAVGLNIEDFAGHTIGVFRGKNTVMFTPLAPVEIVMKDSSKETKILPLPLTSYKDGFFPNTVVENIDRMEMMTL